MSQVTEADLLRATARAASLDDRLEGARMVPCDPGLVADRLARWRGHAAGGDEPEFAAYLTEIGLQPAEAAGLMSDVEVPDAGAAPPWTHMLGDIVRRARSGDDAGDPTGIPFGHLWTAAAGAARHAITGALDPSRRRLLARDVLDGVVQDFLRDVGNLGARAVYEAFSGTRQRLREAGTVERAYCDFVEDQRSAGLPVLVRRYPVLGRLVAQRASEVASATGELLTRLQADRRALIAAFWPDGDPGLVTSITFGLGDRHRSGRTVARVEFERGLTIAYKPRPVRAEHALNTLLAALDDAGLAAPFAPQVLDRGEYGWAGWVDQRESADAGELAEYYKRAGTLLALAWVLGSTDLHAENIVAAGTRPAVIDGEMISPPRLAPGLLRRSDLREAADARVADILQESVAAIGLLPTWLGTNGDDARDVSGLTGSYSGGGIVWMGLNTADMVPVLDPLPVERSHNAPTSGNIVTTAAAGLRELLDGYTAADRWLGAHQQQVNDLVTTSGLLTAEARVTFRATALYALIIKMAMNPALLGDGLDRSLALEAVSSRRWWPPALVNLHASDPAGARRITAAERHALERADIPLFLARPTDTDLVAGGATVAGVFSGKAEAVLHDRLRRIGAPHRQDQVLLARGSFETLRHRATQRNRPPQSKPAGAPAASLDRGARRLADLVTERAVHVGDGVSWAAIDEDARISRPALRPIRTDLYGGRAGLGVFLAAGATHWGDEELARLAADCLRPVAEAARSAGLDDLGGGLSGTSSAIYGLAVAAELLCDSSLTLAAQQASAHVETLIAQDPGSLHQGPLGAGDASTGLFGAALALTGASMHGAGTQAARAAASIVARVLATEDLDAAGLANLCQAADHDGGGDAGLRLGIAHGVTGAALALHRVSAAVHDAHLAQAADTVLGVTDTILAAEPGEIELLDGRWCRGTAGIAAAAVAMGHRCRTPSWGRRIEFATRRARDGTPLTQAGVCCGQGGAVELLTLAGEARAARAVGASLIPRAAHGWSLGLQPGVAPLLPGFHQGAAGLGYTFLRALSPARLPPILVWG